MPAVFLSYRRADTVAYAGRLADALEKHFGEGCVFQDIEAIAPGSNFVAAIDEAIACCAVLVVLIGDDWISERAADGTRRLDDARDFVRLEVSSALRAGKPVLPVLVEGAEMPPEDALPADLRALARLQGLELSDTRWDYDVERVAKAIRSLTGGAPLQRSKRALMFAGAGLLIAALAAMAGYRALNRPAEVAGRWNLPNSSFWIVVQNERGLTIEETHYDSKQVWKRGNGTVHDNGVEFVLDLVYGVGRYEGTLRLSRDGTTLSGEIRDAQRGTKGPLALTRER